MLFIYSSGRDRVLILWDISSGASLRVLPVYEEIEGIFIIPKNVPSPVFPNKKGEQAVHVAAAGEKGTVKFLLYCLEYLAKNKHKY